MLTSKILSALLKDGSVYLPISRWLLLSGIDQFWKFFHEVFLVDEYQLGRVNLVLNYAKHAVNVLHPVDLKQWKIEQ